MAPLESTLVLEIPMQTRSLVLMIGMDEPMECNLRMVSVVRSKFGEMILIARWAVEGGTHVEVQMQEIGVLEILALWQVTYKNYILDTSHMSINLT